MADCDSEHPRLFEQPVLQTLQMFVGESGCWLVVLTSIITTKFSKKSSRVGYTPVTNTDTVEEDEQEEEEDDDDELEQDAGLSSSQTLVDPTNLLAKALIDGEELNRPRRRALTGFKILLLALPAVCDICGTTLMNVGLLFVAASIYQMTRGALVLFVGLFSVIFLKRHLGPWKWASLFGVVAGVAIVGLAGALADTDSSPSGSVESPEKQQSLQNRSSLLLRASMSAEAIHTARETIIGVLMIAGAQIFTASQFVIEESIMEHYSMDPIEVVGWEGTFGFIITLIGMGVLHLGVGSTPRGRGGYFDARESFSEMFGNKRIAISSLFIMFSIG